MIMVPREPRITINGHELTEAQAMTLRVAVQVFSIELQNDRFRDDCGRMGRLYQNRLRELTLLMVEEI